MSAAAPSWSAEHAMVVRRIGSGRELVWLHGLGEQSASFDAITSHLSGFTHVLPDLPGYGRSRWPATPPSLVELADLLAAWIGEDRRPIIAGHSMGGVLAQLVAERVPLAGLIDIEGNLSRGDCTFSGRALAYTPDDFVTRGFDAIRDDIYQAGVTERALRGYHAALRMASPHVFHRHALELVELSASEVLAPRLAALTIPVHYLAGAPRGICERSRALLAAHAVPWTSIEDAGHWPFIDQPDAFAAQVRRFTAALAPAK